MIQTDSDTPSYTCRRCRQDVLVFDPAEIPPTGICSLCREDSLRETFAADKRAAEARKLARHRREGR